MEYTLRFELGQYRLTDLIQNMNMLILNQNVEHLIRDLFKTVKLSSIWTKFKSILSSDHQYVNSSSTSFIVTQSLKKIESLTNENKTSDDISEMELLAKDQSFYAKFPYFSRQKGVLE